MDFHKLTNFQLYSIIHSRHLDREDKEAAINEFNRRGLTDEEIQQFADELAVKMQSTPSFLHLSPNILLLIGAIILIFLLRQCTITH